jgi:hypothetical protein
MAKPVSFKRKAPRGKKPKRDPTGFNFGHNAGGKRRRGFGGGS